MAGSSGEGVAREIIANKDATASEVRISETKASKGAKLCNSKKYTIIALFKNEKTRAKERTENRQSLSSASDLR